MSTVPFAELIALRGMAANIGAAMEKAAFAWRERNDGKAMRWEIIAADLTYLLRNVARGTMKDEAITNEHRLIMDQWDTLNEEGAAQ